MFLDIAKYFQMVSKKSYVIKKIIFANSILYIPETRRVYMYIYIYIYTAKNFKELHWMYLFAGAIYIKMQERLIQ